MVVAEVAEPGRNYQGDYKNKRLVIGFTVTKGREVHQLFVHPDFYGMGAGKRLLHAAETCIFKHYHEGAGRATADITASATTDGTEGSNAITNSGDPYASQRKPRADKVPVTAE